jgi:hypothetical protein
LRRRRSGLFDKGGLQFLCLPANVYWVFCAASGACRLNR